MARLTSVLVIKVNDVSGGLDSLLSAFTEAEVNIEYMYAFTGGKKPGEAYMIFRVADTKAAEAKLSKKGLNLLNQEDIAQL